MDDNLIFIRELFWVLRHESWGCGENNPLRHFRLMVKMQMP
ncbi:hypothetical protein LPE509_03069 [Legionella pneumophila subsp. pneumophila LPE509]|nr:hypothetical protein LPE509_03069 [Legionella pneumophila subsp. pneumophila LPE509]